MIRESDLYPPIKQYLTDAGYDVKAEVTGCDVVACKDDAPTVIVEMKTSLSLDLVLQGVDRLKLYDDVYIAVPKPDTAAKRRNWRKRRRPILGLCRRLGLGLMLVDLERGDTRAVEVLLDPAPYQPRKNSRQQARLKREFEARSGDPNMAGVSRVKIITAYRQDAIRCATAIANGKELSVAEIRKTADVPRAGSILQNNHYGWFERVRRGVYRLSDVGTAALHQYADVTD